MPDSDLPIVRILVAAVLAGLIAIVARRKGLLDPGGAIAAAVLGIALVGIGGWWTGILLVAFFLTSSQLSTSKSGSPSRTWRQVVANGGPALLFASLAVLFDLPLAMAATAACLAAATADTWATEIGRRSGAIPRSITSFRKVPIGTSGAISVPGSVASVAGAAGIAGLAVMLRPLAPIDLPGNAPLVVAIIFSGSIGSLVDTILGATLQARYRCETCGMRTEFPKNHHAEHHLRLESGLTPLTNDAVNFSASAAAGVVAMVILLAGP